MYVDLSTTMSPPMKFLLQRAYRPAGITRLLSNGLTESRFPWYMELALPTSEPGGAGVLYFVPRDENSGLLLACLDEAPTAFFNLMNGVDFGEAVTDLVGRHWPQVLKMLREGQSATPKSRMLCQIRTASKVQWAIADPLPTLDEVPGARIADLLTTSLKTVLDIVEFPLTLPGVVPVLGGPDRTSRRLTALAGLFGTAGGLDYLDGGIELHELKDLATSIVETVKNLRALKD